MNHPATLREGQDHSPHGAKGTRCAMTDAEHKAWRVACQVFIDAAVAYLGHGFSILSLQPLSKKPGGRWKRLQTHRFPVETARRWWGMCSPIHNIGIIGGAISGGLVVLDIEPEHLRRVESLIAEIHTPT